MSTIIIDPIDQQQDLQQQQAQQQQPQQGQQSTQQQSVKQQSIQQIKPIILLKQPQLFKSTFYQLTKSGFQYFKVKDYQKGLTAFNKVLDLLDLGKNILTPHISKYHKVTILANIAYGYQAQRKLQKCNRFCERTKEQLQRLIQNSKIQHQQEKNKESNEGHSSMEKYLKLSKFLVTLKFQHCAIVSQLQQHQKALQMCKSTLPQLKEQIQAMLKYLRSQGSTSRLLQKKTGETVQFSRQVNKFAEHLLMQLLNYLNEPLKKYYFYYWQKNIQQNEEQIKKKFLPTNLADSSSSKMSCKRSILGVNKSSHWIDQFNIGTIMHMGIVNIEDFQVNLPMEQYFFKDKLYEIVILCSLSYFTMATQIRFIEPNKQQTTENSKQKSEQSAPNSSESANKSQQSQIQSSLHQSSISTASAHQLNILKKYGYESKSQLFKISELYHLRSIQIISKNIQTIIPYLSHIIKSYEKHYLKKKQLQPICAINQQSQSFQNDQMNQSLRQYMPIQHENIYQNYMKKELRVPQPESNQGNLLLDSQDRRSSLISSVQSSEQRKNQLLNQNSEDLNSVKNVLNFNHSESVELTFNPSDLLKPFMKEPQGSKLNVNMSKKKNLSRIVDQDEQKAASFVNPNNNNKQTQRQRSPQDIQHEMGSVQYLKSKKSLHETKKKSKSKNKMNNIKSREKQSTPLSSHKNSQKSQNPVRKNLYTYRSPQVVPRPLSKSHYHQGSQVQTVVRKFQSPDLVVPHNQDKKRLIKSKEKIFKKFITVPNGKFEEGLTFGNIKNQQFNGTKKSKNKQKTHQKQKKSSKYFTKQQTDFEGQKQYRIKHQTTTHIKVLYKKKKQPEAH